MPTEPDGPRVPSQPGEQPSSTDRRSVLGALTVLTFVIVGAAYGVFASILGRFLLPREERETRWLYVTRAKTLAVGDTTKFKTPTGHTVNITRMGNTGSVNDFLALSSVCPHLGCQVHWEAVNERFFCPCHNGAFAADGSPISGPPAEAGQSLPRYDLQLRRGLVFIQSGTEKLLAKQTHAGSRIEARRPAESRTRTSVNSTGSKKVVATSNRSADSRG